MKFFESHSRSLFRAHLARHIAAWVFASIVVIEAIILVPSYMRRQSELLDHLEQIGKTTVFHLARLSGPLTPQARLLEMADALTTETEVLGLAIYDAKGALVHVLGEAPELGMADLEAVGPIRRRSADGRHYDVAWKAGTVSPANSFIARLDASSVGSKLRAYVGNIAFLVLIISCFVTFATMLVLRPFVLTPILRLRDNLLAAARDQEHSGRYRLTTRRSDELGDVIGAFNDLLDHLAAHLGEIRERETRLRQLVRDLAHARDQAQQASQAKSVFLANTSHELRTPLNAIIGYSEMLMEDAGGPENAELASDLEKIRGSAHHLLGLINEILDLSKIEAGKMEVLIEEFDVAASVRDVAATVEPIAERNGNAFDVECAGDAGTMRSDAAKFRQSLLNVLGNACKFTKDGSIRLRVTREARDGADWIFLETTDTGIGISPRQMGNLFKDFMQADPATTRKYGGTGLGLAITRRFCQMLGGDVTVRSEQGKGSTFTIELPARAPQPQAGEEPGSSTEERPPRLNRADAGEDGKDSTG